MMPFAITEYVEACIREHLTAPDKPKARFLLRDGVAYLWDRAIKRHRPIEMEDGVLIVMEGKELP